MTGAPASPQSTRVPVSCGEGRKSKTVRQLRHRQCQSIRFAAGSISGQVVAPPPPVEDAEHDAFIALQQWVERGIAPQRLVATKYVDDQPSLGIQMTRPICVFPMIPHYSGHGDTNDAANFACVQDNTNANPTPAPEYLK
jgi:hypothetical protein